MRSERTSKHLLRAPLCVVEKKGWQVHKDKKMRAQRGQEIEFVNEMVRQGVSPAPFRHPIDCMDFTTQVLDCSLPRKQALGLQRAQKGSVVRSETIIKVNHSRPLRG